MPSVRRARRAAFCGQQEPASEYTTIPSHLRSQYLQSAIRSHPSFTQPASTTRVIPTLYGVLPTILQPRIFRFAATNHAATRRPDRIRYQILIETLRVSPFPVLNLPRRTSCATPTHGVSRFRFSPPIIIDTIAVAIEPRSPHTHLKPIYHLSRVYKASIVLLVWLNKSLSVGSYSLNRFDCPATLSLLYFYKASSQNCPEPLHIHYISLQNTHRNTS
jgi:hypothetical protein